jgi:hypothetical protein
MTQGASRVADLNSYFNNIYEDAVFVVHEQAVATRLVTAFADGKGDQTRTNSTYPSITPTQVAETEDYNNPTRWDKSLLATLTPYEYQSQGVITDRRMATDPQNAASDMSLEAGAGFADKIDSDILGNFSSLTGGTVGASGSTMIWGYFFAAISRLVAAKVPRPYVCVLHPYLWHDLAEAVAPGATVTNAPSFQDQVLQSWFVGRVANVDIFSSSNVPAGSTATDAYGAVFNPRAIAFDLRKPLTMERERDASARAWELNWTAMYAHGVWRPKWGVQILADATVPTT